MELKNILEAILFTSQKPLTPQEVKELLKATAEQSEDATIQAWRKTSWEDIQAAFEQLQKDHDEAKRSYKVACVAGSWQFVALPEYAPWLKTLLGQKNRPSRLSQPALETLAVVAYRQPVTRTEIEQVRGVAVDGVIQNLLERGIIVQVGRAEVIGRPALYGTTPQFLEYFGLRALEELPAADELRRLPVQKPEALLTVDPGLATVPQEQLNLSQEPPVEVTAVTPESPAPAPAADDAVESVPEPKPEPAPEPPAPEPTLPPEPPVA